MVWTVGHSTRSIQNLIGLLQAHKVQRVVDVRTVPKSRRNPQFNKDELSKALADAHIRYQRVRGLRRPRKDSANTGWRNLSFRGFADYRRRSSRAGCGN